MWEGTWERDASGKCKFFTKVQFSGSSSSLREREPQGERDAFGKCKFFTKVQFSGSSSSLRPITLFIRPGSLVSGPSLECACTP